MGVLAATAAAVSAVTVSDTVVVLSWADFLWNSAVKCGV